MANAELISKIKAEIERLYDGDAPKHDPQCDFSDGYFTALSKIDEFLDTLESEKPIEELEKEIQKYLESKGVGYGGWIDGWKDEDLREIARHFFNLGPNARKI